MLGRLFKMAKRAGKRLPKFTVAADFLKGRGAQALTCYVPKASAKAWLEAVGQVIGVRVEIGTLLHNTLYIAFSQIVLPPCRLNPWIFLNRVVSSFFFWHFINSVISTNG